LNKGILKHAIISGVVGALISGIISYFVPIPITALQNSFGNVISGWQSGFIGAGVTAYKIYKNK